jgi:hypothetical protein
MVTQVDHQEQCGRLMSAWGNEAFARTEWWEQVVEAAARHDEGWRAWEDHPQVMPDGAPRGFVSMEPAAHVAIHRASAAAAETCGDRVGLLVGMHGAGLVMRRLGIDDGMPVLDERPEPMRLLVMDHAVAARARRSRLGEGMGLAEWAWTAYRVLQAIDLLSLYLTWRGLAAEESWSLRRVPRVPGDERGVDIAVTPVVGFTCALEPWPFADDRVDAPVRARVIEDRRYANDADLAAALAAAESVTLPLAAVRPSART